MVYENASTPLWAAGTGFSGPGTTATMQTDGNFVVHAPNGNVIWSSNTAGHQDAWLIMQGDGNLVIYSWEGNPLWASG